MKIVNAAIKFDEFKDGNFRNTAKTNRITRVLKGHSHSCIADMITCMDLIRDLDSYEYGFITDTGEVVDRYKAMKIAKKASQLKDFYRDTVDLELQSYMIDWLK